MLWGRCPEQAGAPAYWPWRRLLTGLVGSRAAAELHEWLGAEASAVARLVPLVRKRLGDALASLPDDFEQVR